MAAQIRVNSAVFAAIFTPLVTVYGILMYVVIKVESKRNSIFPSPFDLTFNSKSS